MDSNLLVNLILVISWAKTLNEYIVINMQCDEVEMMKHTNLCTVFAMLTRDNLIVGTRHSHLDKNKTTIYDNLFIL